MLLLFKMTNSHEVNITSEKIDDHRGSVDSGVTISTIEILPEKNVEYFEKALEHLSEYFPFDLHSVNVKIGWNL